VIEKKKSLFSEKLALHGVVSDSGGMGRRRNNRDKKKKRGINNR
jgi:hypothetical protein